MTTGTDLAELLASATIDGPPPPSITELRRRRRRARRRRAVVAVATGCVAVAVGAAAVLVAVDDQRSFEVTTVDSITVPSPSTIGPPSTELPPTVGERPGGAPILLPADGWQLTFLQSTSYTAPAAEQIAAVGPGGVAGPVAWIRFNAGVETLEYVDGPRNFHDTTSPAGHTVRVGSSTTPGSLTAIRVVEGGSVSATAFDVDEGELLALVDAASVAAGRVQLDPALLPAGFTAHPTSPDRPYLSTQYAIQAAGNRNATVQVSRWAGAGSSALVYLRSTPGAVETEVNGHPVLLAPADPAGGGYAAALMLGGDSWDEPGWAYTVQVPPPAESGFEATRAEIEALLTSLVEIEPDDVIALVPELHDRPTAIDRWLADVPLPATADLSVLREGPPMGRQEGEWVYQVLKCAVVLDWAVTGDAERLDQLAASAGWNVSVDLDRFWDDVGASLVSRGIGVEPPTVSRLVPQVERLAEAREAVTADERWGTALVGDCEWVMPLTGQRQS